LPELWIPFGAVETLVTVQAENLGSVVHPDAEKSTSDKERLLDTVRQASALFVCDSTPPTIELLGELAQGISSVPSLKVYSAAPKRIEAAVVSIKGKVTTLPPPLPSREGGEPVFASELVGEGSKVFLGTGRPDPLFGLSDAKVLSCQNWVTGSHAAAASERSEMEPSPFRRTGSYEKMEELAEKISDSSFVTIVPRGGKVRTVLEDAPFDAIKNGFLLADAPLAKAAIVGIGGRGYDDTLSSALRGVWGSLGCVRKSGSVLVIAECSEGLGSTALELLATGRLSGEWGRKREKYVQGLEEMFYLHKLKDEFDVLFLSGIPEVYAKSKLGLTTARGSGEAVGRLLNRVGRSGKVNVITRAPECRVESA
jgi:hypothetical protein